MKLSYEQRTKYLLNQSHICVTCDLLIHFRTAQDWPLGMWQYICCPWWARLLYLSQGLLLYQQHAPTFQQPLNLVTFIKSLLNDLQSKIDHPYSQGALYDCTSRCTNADLLVCLLLPEKQCNWGQDLILMCFALVSYTDCTMFWVCTHNTPWLKCRGLDNFQIWQEER